jgi:hypothetical protein
VVVDNRNAIRQFLISRRARITPQQAGLPAYGGNRRVAGLRREEVALLAGVSPGPGGQHHRPAASPAGPQRVRPGVPAILDAMTDVPAELGNGRRDILAANRLGDGRYSER